MKKIYAAYLLALTVLVSCGGSNSGSSASAEKPAETAPAAEEVSASVAFTIEGNDMMQFNLDKMEVIEGQKVIVTLKHTGQMSADVMGHNWVLLKPGTDRNAFGMAAVSAKDKGYVPDEMLDQVVAYTKVIGGGESVTIEFEAPAAGYYEFICSFPGHFGVMNGEFVVQPK